MDNYVARQLANRPTNTSGTNAFHPNNMLIVLEKLPAQCTPTSDYHHTALGRDPIEAMPEAAETSSVH